jgi:GTP-binding protein
LRFIDEVKVFLKAGDGGNGCVSFRREKFIEFGGPDGGCGGDGGNVTFEVDPNINTLIQYHYKPHIKAKSGKHGSGTNSRGESAQDLICKVPIGTEIINEDGESIVDLTDVNQSFTIAKGGRGGRGNATFKSSCERSPRHFTYGELGEDKTIILKLKIIADAGLIGYPNAGKSTFLSLISNAKPKIANYPFSTLIPVLGIAEVNNSMIVVGDIPGIIEGASQGIGLGHKFLKHIERCKILVYMIDINSQDILKTYETLRNELALYKKNLENKEHIILLTKCDLCNDINLIDTKKTKLEELTGRKVVAISLKENIKNALNEIKILYDIIKEPKPIVKYTPFSDF